MKTITFKSSEKKAVKNAVLSEMLSPFKVQNFINNHLDMILESGDTIKDLLISKGFAGKKLQLRDLYQVETENGLQVAILKKWGNYKDTNRDCKLLDHNLNPVLIGHAWYISVLAPYTVESFLQSLTDRQRLDNNREELQKVYAGLFDKIEKKTNKANTRAGKAAAKKAKAERKKNIRKMITALKSTEMYCNSHFITVAKIAVNMFAA